MCGSEGNQAKAQITIGVRQGDGPEAVKAEQGQQNDGCDKQQNRQIQKNLLAVLRWCECRDRLLVLP